VNKQIAMCLLWAGAVIGGVATVRAATDAPDWGALGKRWWSHVQYLADDKLEGRNVGTPGYELAAKYVKEQFQAAGLKPAGTRGYEQEVLFDATQIDEAHSSIAIVTSGRENGTGGAEAGRSKATPLQTAPLQFGDEAFFAVYKGMATDVEAEAVFVGYGLSVPENQYDDFAGQDLRGKLAVYITGGPKDIPTAVKAHYQSLEERRKALARAGAIGTVTIPNPKAAEVPWSRTAAARLQVRMQLQDAGEKAPAPKVALVVNPEHADKILARSGHSFSEIMAAVEKGGALPHFPLAVKFRTHATVKTWPVKSENLAGVFAGSDAALNKEYVVVSAHLDHLGVGEPVNGDKIYNGAMDDGSGIASLIEIARELKDSDAKPKRSILFLAVTREEKGLLGSQYFATHPPVPVKNIVADLNMDMFLPLFPLKYLEVQGLGESTLGDDVRAVCEAAGVEVQADKQPDHNRFIRSDQYSFIKKGVPALAFKFGWVPGSPEEKTFNDWYKERYHGPADDANQPVDLAAAAQFDDVLEKLALRVADAERRPEWKAESFFRRFAQ
jgi:Zn-dependent M28 family amino/carboxypeptidase